VYDALRYVAQGFLDYLDNGLIPDMKPVNKSMIVPAKGVSKKDRAAEFKDGEVYLVTDSGKRKVTGSYYTPDYIVKVHG